MAVLIVQTELSDLQLRDEDPEIPVTEAQQILLLVFLIIGSLDLDCLRQQGTEVFTLIIVTDPNNEILIRHGLNHLCNSV